MGRSVSTQTLESSFLRSDLKTFKELAKGWIPSSNVMVSPLLVASSKDLVKKIVREAQVSDASGGNEVDRSMSDDRSRGIHVLSKRRNVDAALQKLGVPFTSWDKLQEQGYEESIRQLNSRISRDTDGVINNFLSPRALENPELSFCMATWLFQGVLWRKPLETASSGECRSLRWNNERQPDINWITSTGTSSLIYRADIRGFDFISIPVSTTGYKTVFVMPPIGDVTSDEIEKVLTQGMSKMISNYGMNHARLFLPKFQIDCEIREFGSKDGSSALHRAAVSVDEKGATVAAATSRLVAECIVPVVKIDRPFYFAMIDHRKPCKPRIVGMAFVNEPRETIFGR